MTIGAGLVVIAVSLLLILSPLLTGGNAFMRFVVVAGIVGLCLGLSSLLHGGWDLWRGR